MNSGLRRCGSDILPVDPSLFTASQLRWLDQEPPLRALSPASEAALRAAWDLHFGVAPPPVPLKKKLLRKACQWAMHSDRNFRIFCFSLPIAKRLRLL